MDYIKPKLTKKRRDNFFKLAFHLYNLIQTEVLDFDMDTFQNKTDCGTIACACGHGPFAGVKMKSTESWQSYAKRCFIGTTNYSNCRYNLHMWCFSAGWSPIDNTPKGAAKRIFMMLEHGIPVGKFFNKKIYESYEPKYLN